MATAVHAARTCPADDELALLRLLTLPLPRTRTRTLALALTLTRTLTLTVTLTAHLSPFTLTPMPAKVLDVGCGIGGTSRYTQASNRNHDDSGFPCIYMLHLTPSRYKRLMDT